MNPATAPISFPQWDPLTVALVVGFIVIALLIAGFRMNPADSDEEVAPEDTVLEASDSPEAVSKD